MDTEDLQAEDSHLVKDLRRQLKEAKQEASQFEAQLSEIRSEFRERTVVDVLKDKGVNPKVAKFIPSDVEGDEAISSWLEENADLFGGSAPVESSGVPEETRTEQSRANVLVDRGVSPDKIADLEQRVANAQTPEEINTVLSEYQKYQL